MNNLNLRRVLWLTELLWMGQKKCIGDIGIYHYYNNDIEYEGQRFEFHRCGISYDDNDGYLRIITPDTTPDMDSLYNKMKLACHMSVDEGCPSYKIEIVRLTKEEDIEAISVELLKRLEDI